MPSGRPTGTRMITIRTPPRRIHRGRRNRPATTSPRAAGRGTVAPRICGLFTATTSLRRPARCATWVCGALCLPDGGVWWVGGGVRCTSLPTLAVTHEGLINMLALWDQRGQGVGLPNLLGVRREEPEQVRDSDASSTQTPKDPICFGECQPNFGSVSGTYEGVGLYLV